MPHSIWLPCLLLVFCISYSLGWSFGPLVFCDCDNFKGHWPGVLGNPSPGSAWYALPRLVCLLTSGQLCIAVALHARWESACPAQWSQGCAFPPVSQGTVGRVGELLLGRRGGHCSPEWGACVLLLCFVETQQHMVHFN